LNDRSKVDAEGDDVELAVLTHEPWPPSLRETTLETALKLARIAS
jgi:hypothetical protein